MSDQSLHSEIRRANRSEASAIAECVNAAYARWIPIIGTTPGPMLQNYDDVLATEQVFVIAEGVQVIALLVLAVTSDGFLLENVAVHPAHSGRGLGGKLLKLAEREAIAQGFNAIHLYTHERMLDNIALYERVGYREFDRRHEQGLSRVYMRKVFNAA